MSRRATRGTTGRCLAAAALLLTAACGGTTEQATDAGPADDPGRAVTPDEADRLAVARFNNYERDVLPVELEVPTASGQVLTLEGRADLQDHRAITTLVTDDARPSHGALAWDFRRAALLPTRRPVATSRLDALARDDGWQVQPLERGDPLASALVVLLNLASDRPENSQLLRQNGATWLGETQVDGRDVTMMTASPEGEGQTVTYYVDDRGRMVRADVEVGLDRPATILLRQGEAAPVPPVPTGRA